ncbi:phage holin family protein [Mycolicibacterium baixiangningiae]|uniref:phage holin family protein n=1 Tax=Mycolicibacterium baixiangningiae TaxID=2761578 RepID=UPI0018D17F57|nr:phage holin family protein [Mycolicibacterium baixiangningiae]
MLIIALVLAVVGLAALVAAVVTGNALIAWVCIAASVIGVVLLIVDAVRERSRTAGGTPAADDTGTPDDFDAEYPDEADSAEHFEADETAVESDPDADTRAVPDERHEDHVGADHPEEPTTR